MMSERYDDRETRKRLGLLPERISDIIGDDRRAAATHLRTALIDVDTVIICVEGAVGSGKTTCLTCALHGLEYDVVHIDGAPSCRDGCADAYMGRSSRVFLVDNLQDVLRADRSTLGAVGRLVEGISRFKASHRASLEIRCVVLVYDADACDARIIMQTHAMVQRFRGKVVRVPAITAVDAMAFLKTRCPNLPETHVVRCVQRATTHALPTIDFRRVLMDVTHVKDGNDDDASDPDDDACYDTFQVNGDNSSQTGGSVLWELTSNLRSLQLHTVPPTSVWRKSRVVMNAFGVAMAAQIRLDRGIYATGLDAVPTTLRRAAQRCCEEKKSR